jgi:predicted MFS family arabinose efflux permease
MTVVETPPRPQASAGLSTMGLAALAGVCAAAIATISIASPILDLIAGDIALDLTSAGSLVSITQLGYFAGLLLLVPLGDLADRKRLIVAAAGLLAIANTCIAMSASQAVAFAALVAAGFSAVVIQLAVAFGSTLALPDRRGRTVGVLTGAVVIGILAARMGAGPLAELGGWRSVYFAAGGLCALLALAARLCLPAEPPRMRVLSYAGTVASMPKLLSSDRKLVERGVLAFLGFAAHAAIQTAMVIELTSSPYAMGHAEIGIFGASAIAGVLGALRAGAAFDKGTSANATTLGICAMAVAALAAASLPHSVVFLALGLIALDFGLQSIHVSNQNVIYRERPESRSRLAAAYMMFYAAGSAAGAFLSTLTLHAAGWSGVCALAFAASALALVWWKSRKQ